MSVDPSVRAGGVIVFAAAGLVALLATPAAQAPAPQVRGSASVLCVAADGVLHAATASGTCAPGQTAVPLATPASGACDTDPWQGTDDCDPPAATTADDLTTMEARVRELESRPLFEVVGRDRRPIFQVTTGRAVLMNAGGDRVVELRATVSGAHLLARNLAGEEVALAVSGEAGGVVMTAGGERRIDYGKQQAGNVSLRFPRGEGITAGIGEATGRRSGAIVVGDAFGRARALMSVPDGRGSVSIQNADGRPVLALTVGEKEAGLLVIGDAVSEPMVKFGVNEDRYGVVLAGPKAGLPYVPATGLPGSYLLGCAGGDKCGPGGGGSR